MNMRWLSIMVTVVLASASAVFAGEPDVGTWKLNLSKSTYSPGPPPKSHMILILRSEGDMTAITDEVDSAGRPNHTEIRSKFDGRDYDFNGSSANTTRAYRRIDVHSFEFTTKVAGKATTTTRVVISDDGKTQTVTTTGRNAQGQTVNNVEVFEKQ